MLVDEPSVVPLYLGLLPPAQKKNQYQNQIQFISLR